MLGSVFVDGVVSEGDRGKKGKRTHRRLSVRFLDRCLHQRLGRGREL